MRNATQVPWSYHYRMYDYIIDELPALIENYFHVSDRRSILWTFHGRSRRARYCIAKPAALSIGIRLRSHSQSCCQPYGAKKRSVIISAMTRKNGGTMMQLC